MPYKLILDGNNIINCWPSLIKIKDFETKKERLVGIMSSYKHRIGGEVCIVFDAQNSYNTSRETKEIAAVTVIHTARGEIADEVIKSIVFKSKKQARQNMIVVTSDNGIKIALASKNIIIFSAEKLREEITYALGDSICPFA